jgi:hypothetical protein
LRLNFQSSDNGSVPDDSAEWRGRVSQEMSNGHQAGRDMVFINEPTDKPTSINIDTVVNARCRARKRLWALSCLILFAQIGAASVGLYAIMAGAALTQMYLLPAWYNLLIVGGIGFIAASLMAWHLLPIFDDIKQMQLTLRVAVRAYDEQIKNACVSKLLGGG